MSKINTITALLVTVVLSLSLQFSVVTAQDSSSTADDATTDVRAVVPQFALVPVGDHPDGYFHDLPAKPGDRIELDVSILNFGEVEVDLTTFKVNADTAVNGGYVAGRKGDPPQGSNNWVTYPEQQIALQPGEQETLGVIVDVPEDALPGQYISGLMAETTDTLRVPGTDTIDQRIGSSITIGILVEGEITPAFELGEPSVDRKESFTVLNIPVSNVGNYLVRPEGEIIVMDSNGDVALSTTVMVRSIYYGNNTLISVGLPAQIPGGEYSLSVSLTDPDSGTTASIEAQPLVIPDQGDASGFTLGEASVTPNSDDVIFADVEITLVNGGPRIGSATVTLHVSRDGELVEDFPIATNQVLISGENEVKSRFIPQTGVWESGDYTFSITVSSLDPDGGPEVKLFEIDLEEQILVP